MKKTTLLSLLLSLASTTDAFLPTLGSSRFETTTYMSTKSNREESSANAKPKDDAKVARIPLGRKERYVRIKPEAPASLAQLEQEYHDLKEKLRHDLFQLKHKQCEVAEEEDALLQEALYELELVREAQELSVLAAEEDYKYAHDAVEIAKMNAEIAAKQFARDQLNWMDSQRNDLESLISLARSGKSLKQNKEALEAIQEAELHAQRRQRHAEELLIFLEEQQTALAAIVKDPKKEQLWVEDELTNHHKSLLQVASLERETEKLWNKLRKDLLGLKRQQIQVRKEEDLLAAKEAEIVALQAQEQKEQVQKVLEEMKMTHLEVKEAVAKKEHAYKHTLNAIEKGDNNPTELWMLAEAAQESNQANQIAAGVKDKLTRLVAKEAQAENLLMLLERKGAILKELRLPGNEKALQKWVEEELLDHEFMLDTVKDNILMDD